MGKNGSSCEWRQKSGYKRDDNYFLVDKTTLKKGQGSNIQWTVPIALELDQLRRKWNCRLSTSRAILRLVRQNGLSISKSMYTID